MMNVYKPVYNVVLREVPGEISIGFMIASCKQGCKGCSYKSLEKYGKTDLQMKDFETILKDNSGLASCVLFMGGEEEEDLPRFLDKAHSYGYKTCMYTGIKTIPEVSVRITSRLDYIKVGRWEGKSLTDEDTNQRFYALPEMKDLTKEFQKKTI